MGWRHFAEWRRSRPLWASMIALAAAAVLALLPLTHARSLSLQGAAGTYALLCASVLAAAAVGLVLWPEGVRTLGLVCVIAGLVSYPAANLGGFLVGMGLALVAGCLAFAWEPVRSP